MTQKKVNGRKKEGRKRKSERAEEQETEREAATQTVNHHLESSWKHISGCGCACFQEALNMWQTVHHFILHKPSSSYHHAKSTNTRSSEDQKFASMRCVTQIRFYQTIKYKFFKHKIPVCLCTCTFKTKYSFANKR